MKKVVHLFASQRVNRKARTDNEEVFMEKVTLITNKQMSVGTLADFARLVEDMGICGIVIGDKKVIIKANQTSIMGSDGIPIALFDTDGKKLNANLIDAETVVANGIQSKNLDAKNATISNLTVNNVKLTGTFRSPFVQVIDSFEAPYTDNVVMLNQEWGGGTVHNLSWDVEQSGRKICIAGSMWNRQPNTIYGQTVLTIPEDAKNNGCRFYENGIAKTELYFSTEVLELIAYGNVAGTKDGKPEKYIYGWIVLNRIDLMTNHKYGRQKKVLAYGKVTGTNNGASIDYKTFDGSKMSISRGDKGLNILHIPKWADSASSIFVTLTNTSSYVSLKSIDTTSDGFNINVLARGTNSFDEGSFNFEISNFDDFG